MSILYPIEYILIGVLLLSGVFSLLMVLAKHDVKQNLIFTIISFLLCIYTYNQLGRYFSNTIEEYLFAEKLIQFSVLLSAGLFILLIDELTKYKNPKLKWILIIGAFGFAILSLTSKYGVDFSSVQSLEKIELFWGEKISFIHSEVRSLFWIKIILIVLSSLYIILSTNHLLKTGNKNEARFIRLAFLIIIVFVLFDNFFIKTGRLNLPFTTQFALILVIFISGMKGLQSVTNSYKTEKALIATKEKFKQLTNVSFDGVCITRDGIIIEVNNQTIELFGYEKSELIGKNINDLFTRITSEEESQNDESGIIEKWARKKDNSEFPCEIRMKASNIEGKRFYVNVLRDITHKKNYQNELIAARDIAQKSERLKTEFLAQMSHEIRSPINTILSFASLLAEEVAGKIDSELEKSFSSMDNAGKRIIRTIDLMLNMSEIQTGTYDPIITDINLNKEILYPIYLDYKKLAKGLNLSFEFIDRTNSPHVIVSGDKYTITQIFENLIDNAIKYTPKGRITILIEQNSNNKIEVQIQDTGIGISEEYKPSIFEKFTQEEQGYTRKYDGNGLGLALVKSYLQINNAELDFISEKNVGSVFKVSFNIKI